MAFGLRRAMVLG